MRPLIALIISASAITVWAEQPFITIDIKSSLRGINNNGQAVGGISNSDGTQSAIMFDGTIHIIASGSTANAMAINDAGVTVYSLGLGSSYAFYDPSTNTSTYLWQHLNAAITQDILKINNNGMMSGNHYYSQTGGRQRYGITCSVADPTLVNLPNNRLYLDTDTYPIGSYAWDLNDAGVVVGSCTWWPGDVNPYQRVACFWTGTTIHKMDTLGYINSIAWAINTRGDIAGTLYNTSATHGFLYSNETMHELANFTEIPVAINDSGVILGATTFYNNGVVESIQGLMPSGWTLGEATDINNSNQVCGYATGPDGLSHGFILQVPEPATLSLLALGGMALLRRRK